MDHTYRAGPILQSEHGIGGRRTMHILVVHQYYVLTGHPGGSRYNEFARYWTARGHRVTVIAGTVDYTTGARPEKYRNRWITEEFDGSVRVLRCHVPASYGK